MHTLSGRYITAAVALLTLGTCALAVGARAHAGVEPAPDAVGLQQSAQLASATLDPASSSVQISGPEAAAMSGALADGVPLPEGGTLDGIQWTELDGYLSRAQARGVIEFNAACQWHRALRDGREVSTATAIIQQLPSWDALRGETTGEITAAAAQDAAAGGGPRLSALLRDCDASHAQELAYIAQRRTQGQQ